MPFWPLPLFVENIQLKFPWEMPAALTIVTSNAFDVQKFCLLTDAEKYGTVKCTTLDGVIYLENI